jgi:transcriptional regulator with XRE-family HTH domain
MAGYGRRRRRRQPMKGISLREQRGRIELARRLQELRLRSGLTFREICERSGIAPGTLAYLERAERTPSIAVLRNLGRVYNTTAVELVAVLESHQPKPMPCTEEPQDDFGAGKELGRE